MKLRRVFHIFPHQYFLVGFWPQECLFATNITPANLLKLLFLSINVRGEKGERSLGPHSAWGSINVTFIHVPFDPWGLMSPKWTEGHVPFWRIPSKSWSLGVSQIWGSSKRSISVLQSNHTCRETSHCGAFPARLTCLLASTSPSPAIKGAELQIGAVLLICSLFHINRYMWMNRKLQGQGVHRKHSSSQCNL